MSEFASMMAEDHELTAQHLESVAALRPVIEQHAADGELHRRLSPVVYEAMAGAGLFGMAVPRAHGGSELHPVGFLRVIEAIARIDCAAAWTLEMNQMLAAYAAWLPAQGTAALFGDGPVTVAGALFPPARAVRAKGGWRLTGQVAFASGCNHARWLMMPGLEMIDGQPKIDEATGQPAVFWVFFPSLSANVTILDTWHTLGMRGSGSNDFAVDNLFVPDHFVAPIRPLQQPAPGFEGPLFRLWPFSGTTAEAIVSVGIAAAAVEAGIELCKSKTPNYLMTPLRDQQLAQFSMGKAQARVNASRDVLHCAIEAGYAEVLQTGATLSWDAKVRLQLALTFAAEATAEAVRLVNEVIATASIRTGPFERYFRDVHTLLQHTDKAVPRYASAGRIMFGLPNDYPFMSF